MKISEVIKNLQEVQKEHGDLLVWVNYSEINDDNFILLWNDILNIEIE